MTNNEIRERLRRIGSKEYPYGPNESTNDFKLSNISNPKDDGEFSEETINGLCGSENDEVEEEQCL